MHLVVVTVVAVSFDELLSCLDFLRGMVVLVFDDIFCGTVLFRAHDNDVVTGTAQWRVRAIHVGVDELAVFRERRSLRGLQLSQLFLGLLERLFGFLSRLSIACLRTLSNQFLCNGDVRSVLSIYRCPHPTLHSSHSVVAVRKYLAHNGSGLRRERVVLLS